MKLRGLLRITPQAVVLKVKLRSLDTCSILICLKLMWYFQEYTLQLCWTACWCNKTISKCSPFWITDFSVHSLWFSHVVGFITSRQSCQHYTSSLSLLSKIPFYSMKRSRHFHAVAHPSLREMSMLTYRLTPWSPCLSWLPSRLWTCRLESWG